MKQVMLRDLVIIGVFAALAILFTACGSVDKAASQVTEETAPTSSPPSTFVAQEEASKEEFIAPDFVLDGFQTSLLKDDKGETIYRELSGVHLSDYRGKLVLIEFWGSWCPYCAKHMPGVEAAYRQYRERGFVVLGVEIMQVEGIKGVKRFIEDNGLTFPILLDRGEAQRLYAVKGTPTSILIRPDGKIERRFLGAGYNWNSAAAAGLIERHLPVPEAYQSKKQEVTR